MNIDSLHLWSWVFVTVYMLAMIGVGIYAGRQVKSGDDYAVARHSYGPFMLSLAFAATTASGATFLGIPAMAYKLGIPVLWYAFLYPLGVYLGVLICLRAVSAGGENFGSRSIPEYLGDRYNSEFIRLAFALFSLTMIFYLAGQLVAGLVMFEQLLGLSKAWALSITTMVLLIYVVIGGAHADIITDGIQGVAMLLIAVVVAVLFARGVDGQSVMSMLERTDTDLVRLFAVENPIFISPLAVAGIVIAHIPLGMLPHIGNKIWALKSGKDRHRFIIMSFVFGMILPLMVLGGLLARIILGEQLLGEGFTPNEAIPALFIEVLPTWLAALLSVAILSAIMSTADGLVVSASQVFANDIYRRTLVPRMRTQVDAETVDRSVLVISRWATVFVLLGAAGMAWALMDMNVALIVWIGIGGMTSALSGPLLLGSLWSPVNRTGAIVGMFAGAATFIILHTGGLVAILGQHSLSWLSVQSDNPFTCSAIGVTVSLLATVISTLITEPLTRDVKA